MNVEPNWFGPQIEVGFGELPEHMSQNFLFLRRAVGSWFDGLENRFSACPWSATAGIIVVQPGQKNARARAPLYSAEERSRRDATPWTMVQGILAPIQFLIFAISLALVVKFLLTGEGYAAATISVVVKTATLYTIMITGSIWEKEVFGKWLFAPAFYWEDMVSMLVLALHTAYLIVIALHWGTPTGQMALALAAYATYVINATQFVLKLRAARLDMAPLVLGQAA